jgi:hypothetical protein
VCACATPADADARVSPRHAGGGRHARRRAAAGQPQRVLSPGARSLHTHTHTRTPVTVRVPFPRSFPTPAVPSSLRHAYAQLGRAAEALRDADAALAVRPRWAKGHIPRGAALAALCRYDDASDAYADALRLEPSNEAARAGAAAVAAARARGGDERSRGNAAFGAREFADAVRHYTAALTQLPSAGAAEEEAVLRSNRSAAHLALGATQARQASTRCARMRHDASVNPLFRVFACVCRRRCLTLRAAWRCVRRGARRTRAWARRGTRPATRLALLLHTLPLCVTLTLLRTSPRRTPRGRAWPAPRRRPRATAQKPPRTARFEPATTRQRKQATRQRCRRRHRR